MRRVRAFAANGVPTEDAEEAAFSTWLDYNHIFHSHLSNEIWTTSYSQKQKMKMLGVHSGTPDHYCVLYDRKNKITRLVFIEMKRQKGGVISDSQYRTINEINRCHGVFAFVAYGATQAINICKAVMSGDEEYLSERLDEFEKKYLKNQEKIIKKYEKRKKEENPF